MYSTVGCKKCDSSPQVLSLCLDGWVWPLTLRCCTDICVTDKRKSGGGVWGHWSLRAMLTNQNSCFSRPSVHPRHGPPAEAYNCSHHHHPIMHMYTVTLIDNLPFPTPNPFIWTLLWSVLSHATQQKWVRWRDKDHYSSAFVSYSTSSLPMSIDISPFWLIQHPVTLTFVHFSLFLGPLHVYKYAYAPSFFIRPKYKITVKNQVGVSIRECSPSPTAILNIESEMSWKVSVNAK